MSDKILRAKLYADSEGILNLDEWLEDVFEPGDKVVVILESEYERLKALESPTT